MQIIVICNQCTYQVKVVNTKKGAGHVVLVSSEEVRSFPLFRCDKANTCTQCVALQVPDNVIAMSDITYSTGRRGFFVGGGIKKGCSLGRPVLKFAWLPKFKLKM